MKDIKRTVLIIAISGLTAFITGAVSYSLGLGAYLPTKGTLAAFIGKSAGSFGMKCCLVAVLGVVILVPNIRAQFSGSYSAGSNYKNAHKKGGRGGSI